MIAVAFGPCDGALAGEADGSECRPFVIPVSASDEDVSALVVRCRASLRQPRSHSAAPMSAPSSISDDEARTRCGLDRQGWEGAASATCRKCHVSHGPSHPVDLDYAKAHARRGRLLRPARVVVAAGLNLPAGEIRCVTCHSGTSTARYRIALPSGAFRRPGRDLPHATRSRLASGRPLVEATPLCNACHTTADEDGSGLVAVTSATWR